MDETDLITDLPGPITAALRFLDYCRFRQMPVDDWGEPKPAPDLDLDEMRARESALKALGRYFDAFVPDVESVFEAATAAIREADAARGNEQRDPA